MRTGPLWLLRLDSAAGAAVGLGFLVSHRWLAAWYLLPESLVLGLGVANLAYASYSGTLAWRQARGRAATRRAWLMLAGANVAWTGVCGSLLLVYVDSASALGLAHLALEGLFVGGLGVFEATRAPARRSAGADA